MNSLRSHEGSLFIDNRNSPGVPDSVMVPLGYAPGAGKGLYESATYTCSHCNRVVIIEPRRTRERGFCRKCSARICDPCTEVMAKTLTCRSMKEIIDETLEQAVKQTDPVPSILLGT